MTAIKNCPFSIYLHGREEAIDEEFRHWEDGTGDELQKERLEKLNIFARAWKKKGRGDLERQIYYCLVRALDGST